MLVEIDDSVPKNQNSLKIFQKQIFSLQRRLKEHTSILRRYTHFCASIKLPLPTDKVHYSQSVKFPLLQHLTVRPHPQDYLANRFYDFFHVLVSDSPPGEDVR